MRRACWRKPLRKAAGCAGGSGYWSGTSYTGGAARQRSKELGLWVSLCAGCHRTGREAVHNCRATREELQGAGQLAAMRAYGWSVDDFRAQIGKSYILAEEESA